MANTSNANIQKTSGNVKVKKGNIEINRHMEDVVTPIKTVYNRR